MYENLNGIAENLNVLNNEAGESNENLFESPEGNEPLQTTAFLGNAEVREKEQDLANAIKMNRHVTAAENALAQAKAREISEKMG